MNLIWVPGSRLSAIIIDEAWWRPAGVGPMGRGGDLPGGGPNALSPIFTIGVAGLSVTMADNVPRFSGHDM